MIGSPGPKRGGEDLGVARADGREVWVALAIAALAAAVYLPSLANGFVYDDRDVILAQPPPRSAADLARLFAEPHFRGLPYYRPVTRATLLVEKAAHGDVASLFHLANALLMGATAALAYALLRSPSLGVARGPAALAALLFAVHPVASSTVYPIASGRETLLPAALALATTAAFLRGRDATAAVCFTAALFAKEQAVVLPLVLLLALALGLAPRRPAGRALPYALAVAVYLAVRLSLFGGAELRPAVLEDPLRPLWSFAYALQVSLAPFAELVYEPELGTWLSPDRLAICVGIVGVAAAAWRRLREPPGAVVAFWAGWFVLLQLPTANLLRQEAAFAERYVFLAWLALPALAAGMLSPLWHRPRIRIPALVVGGALACVLAALSMGRAGAFHDDLRFAAQWLRTDPGAPEAHHILALARAREGRFEEALAHYERALERSPDSADLHQNLALALVAVGREAEAVAHLREALRLAPEHPEAHVNLGVLLAREGRLDEAIDHYRAALRSAPRSAEAHNDLGTALARRGDWEAAARHLAEAVRLRPGYADAHRNLARVLLASGDRAGAAERYRVLLALVPGDPEARGFLASAEAHVTR